MTKQYTVFGSYSIPYNFELDTVADDELDAGELALKEMEMQYPEAIDLEIIEIRETND